MMSTSMPARGGLVDDRFATNVLRLDAVASGGLGVLLAVFSSTLEEPLGLRPDLAVRAGLFLVLWAAVLIAVGARSAISRTALLGVVAVNLCWVVASFALLFGLGLNLTGLGVAFVIAQAVVVAAFAVLQLIARRRA